MLLRLTHTHEHGGLYGAVNCLPFPAHAQQSPRAVRGSSLSADLAVTPTRALFMKHGRALHPYQYAEDIKASQMPI